MSLDIMSLMAASAAVTDSATTQTAGAAPVADASADLPPAAQFASILQSLKEESSSDLALSLPAAEAELAAQLDAATLEDLNPDVTISGSLIAGSDGRTLPLDGNGLPVGNLARGNLAAVGQSDALARSVGSRPQAGLLSSAIGAGATGRQTGWFSASGDSAGLAATPNGVTLANPALAASTASVAPDVSSKHLAPARGTDGQAASQAVAASDLVPFDELAPGVAASRTAAASQAGVIKEGLPSLTAMQTGLATLDTPSGMPLSRQPSGLALAQTNRTTGDGLVPQLAAVNLAQQGWDRTMSQRLVMMASRGMESAELRLDPPQLGAMQVKLAMQGDQAQLVMQVGNPAAREAMEAALPRLREMLGEQGLQLDNAEVTERHAGEQRTSQQESAGGDNSDDGHHASGEATALDTNVESLTLEPGRIHERV